MLKKTITDRIDAITKIKKNYLLSCPPPPKSVKIELSPRCNYRCGFCALRNRVAQPKEDMNIDFYETLISELRGLGVKEIGLFYLGESFMNPNLLKKAIKLAKQKYSFPYVFLTSNASLAYPEIIKECMELGLDSLKWSINASNAKQFSEIMAVSPKYFHRALRNIKLAFEQRNYHKYKTGLYASSIMYEDSQKDKMENFLSINVYPFVDEHYWLPLYSMGAFSTKREEELGFKPIAGNQGRLGALRRPIPCWSAFTEGHVTAQGMLSACCFDASGYWTMGNLNKISFLKAWHSSDFSKLRQAHLNSNVSGTLCENCIAYS